MSGVGHCTDTDWHPVSGPSHPPLRFRKRSQDVAKGAEYGDSQWHSEKFALMRDPVEWTLTTRGPVPREKTPSNPPPLPNFALRPKPGP